MERLNYQELENIGYDGYILKDAPEKVLQFGEGNFLRAFADCFIDILNEKAGFNGKVCICQPRGSRMCDVINSQEGLYTLLLRGQQMGKMVNEKRVISCVSRCINPNTDYDAFIECAHNPSLRFIISNTTEAGIVYDPSCELSDIPASSFPGKLTQFLYERFTYDLPGFIILSCELIDRNGDRLLECVENYISQWQLGDDFALWVKQNNTFCSTLVDRIVPGYPRDEADSICEELGYRDELLCTGEVFANWVIEGDRSILDEFPVDKADLPVYITGNVDHFKKRKVRILNGSHTAMSLAAYLAGKDTVGECMKDQVISGYIRKALYEEILPVLTDFDKNDLDDFAEAVFDRFANPFIHHELLSIALNSTAKWKARVMPTVVEYYEQNGKLPDILTFSFAAYISFYHTGYELTESGLTGSRNGQDYLISDDRYVLEEFYDLKDAGPLSLAEAVTGNRQMWDDTLADLPGFTQKVAGYIELIQDKGMYEAMKEAASINN